MIGPLDLYQRCLRQRGANRLDQIPVGQFIPAPLQEQHGHFYFFQMLGPVDGRLSRGMQRKAIEDDPFHGRIGMRSEILRGHPPAKGFARCIQRQGSMGITGVMDRCGDRLMRYGRSVGPPLFILFKRKIEPQGGHAGSRQGSRQLDHK